MRTEANFLTRYRAHVLEQYGKLEPPDFERRLRVPIDDIYVPTVIYEESKPEWMRLTPDAEPPSITVWELADRLDRTVLLGDPGGGKTTASIVLMHHFASDEGRRVPFLVTLRNFASEDPPARSVVGFIEHELETLYQCPAPPGFVDLLLLTGRAVVIFDGLDELLDTARRAEVSTRVERFCTEYPLAPVLVTSRVVGYDQARLDESQFTGYRLGGFRDEDVAEYARKWFSLDEGARPDDADAFMTESESVPDLRSNPLLLSLMCILYRGEGSLPRNRAEVYEQCANLLFRRWDARRHIHQDLRAGHLLEPALRHLAWWLFTHSDTQAAVTERELVAAATEFLHDRGFESLDDAREAACEFVEFSRGRMWVFSDHGTTAIGDKLYAFTHRTFLEYFTAAYLAYDNDTPEKLARVLAQHIARNEWEIVGELAVQIKDTTSRDGAKRIYEYLVNEHRRRSPRGRSNILQFLARSLRSVDPSPQVTRLLAESAITFLFSGNPATPTYYRPLYWLLGNCGKHATIISEEIDKAITSMILSSDPEEKTIALHFTAFLHNALHQIFADHNSSFSSSDHQLAAFWDERSKRNVDKYREFIVALCISDEVMRVEALQAGFITMGQVLEMPEGLSPLLRFQHSRIFGGGWSALLCVYFQWLVWQISEESFQIALDHITATGRYISLIGSPPWACGLITPWTSSGWSSHYSGTTLAQFEPTTYLGGAAVALISAEESND